MYNLRDAYKCADSTLLSDSLSVLQGEIARKLLVMLKRVCQPKELKDWSSVLWFARTVSLSISTRSTIIKYENLFKAVWKVLLQIKGPFSLWWKAKKTLKVNSRTNHEHFISASLLIDESWCCCSPYSFDTLQRFNPYFVTQMKSSLIYCLKCDTVCITL